MSSSRAFTAGRAFNIAVVSRPDFRQVAEALRREQEALAKRIADRLVQREIPPVFSTQGVSLGQDRWAPRHPLSGGGPALIGIASRTRYRVTPSGFSIFWDWSYAGQQQGRKAGGGGFIPGGGRQASPLMWLSFRPGVKSPRELQGTFLLPLKGKVGSSAAGSSGWIVMQRLKGQKEPTAVGLLVPRVSIPQRRFGAWFERYRAAASDEYADGVEAILANALR